MKFRNERVGVIMGGPSSEREVSLQTGRGILDALLSRGYDAVDIDWKAGESLPAALQQSGVQVVWNALHGVWGEDGAVQGLLECMGIPYTGSGVMGSAIAMDKVMTRRIFDQTGVGSPRWRVLPAADHPSAPAALAEAREHVGFPMVVKPSREGSSVGISIVRHGDALGPAIDEARRHHGQVLLEEYVAGQEINVAVLEGHGDGGVLGDVEVRPATEFYDYEAKYKRNDTQYLCPAPVSAADHARLADLGRRAHAALGCHGYSRVDAILAADGRIICLEVNTLPGMTAKSLFPKIAASVGMDYAALAEAVLQQARLNA